MAEGGYDGLEDTKKKTDDEQRKVQRMVDRYSSNQRLTDQIEKTVQYYNQIQQIASQLPSSEERLKVQLERVEKKGKDINEQLDDLTISVAKLEHSANGLLRWKIPKQDIHLDKFTALFSDVLTVHFGLETWQFKLALYPEGKGQQGYASLDVILVESPFQLLDTFFGSLNVRLVNMDQIHLPTDKRTPRLDFTGTVPPCVLSNDQKKYTICDFFPHSVFGLAQGFVLEDSILIEAKAEMSRSTSKKQVEEWLMDNDRCSNPFESSS